MYIIHFFQRTPRNIAVTNYCISNTKFAFEFSFADFQRFLDRTESEVGIYKRKQKSKKERKHAFDQEKKKKL